MISNSSECHRENQETKSFKWGQITEALGIIYRHFNNKRAFSHKPMFSCSSFVNKQFQRVRSQKENRKHKTAVGAAIDDLHRAVTLNI